MENKPQADDLVTTLVELALTRPEQEHEAYLRSACGSNSELFVEAWNSVQCEKLVRRIVVDPLHRSEESDRPFEPGEVLINRFRIVREVAQGGMGIVFEAVDERLDRQVAIKCAKSGFRKRLPPEVRNAREISHPNVCKIFEIHTAAMQNGEIDFISMEFLEGETLSARLRRVLSKEEARAIALQLCAGLTEAHRNHVIHGDLKTNNVIVTNGPEGSMRAVITDFGLARRPGALERTVPSAVLAGTPEYMAPELWKGQKASVASDIYALGVILWELFSGKRPSDLGLNSSTVSWDERLTWKPPVGRGKENRIIARCLDPDTAHRFHSAEEVARALGASRLRTWMLTSIAAAAAIVIAVLVTAWYSSPADGSRQARLKPQRVTATSTENPIVQSTLSPDGNTIAYGNDSGIHLQRIATNETVMLPRPVTLSREDSWWPIGWLSGGHLLATSAAATSSGLKLAAWIVSTPSGHAIRIREDCLPYAVSPDGSLIAFTAGGSSLHEEIWVMGPQGEAARKIQGSHDKDTIFSSLHWSPDGRRIAYRKEEVDGAESVVQSTALDGGPPVTLVSDAYRWGDFCWLADGRFLFSSTGEGDPQGDMNLWELRIDAKTGVAAARGRQLTDWTGFRIENLSSSRNGRRLAFNKISSQTDVFVAELHGAGPAKSSRRLTLDDYDDYPFFWSDDNKAVFFSSAQAGSFHILRQSLDQDQAVPIVSSPDSIGPIRQTPDGSSLLYITYALKSSRLMLAPLAGGTSREYGHLAGVLNVACSRNPARNCVAGTADSQRDHLVFSGFEPPDPRFHPLFEIESDIRRGRSWALSPDGSEIAVNKNNQDNAEIEVYSLEGVLKRSVEVTGFNRLLAIDYAPDGQSWVIGAATATGCALLRVSLDGRHVMLSNLRGLGMRSYGILSPNGQHLAFLGWTISRNTWVVDLLQDKH